MPDIVALHGFTGCGEDFQPLREHLPAGVSLLAPDFPGHGTRSGVRRPEEYSFESHLRIITDAVGEGEPVTLLGYSMGGRIALHWALAHPTRIRRLVLVGASPGLATPEEREERQRGDEALARHIIHQGLPGFYKFWHTLPFFQPLFRLPADRLDPIVARRNRNEPEGLALSLQHVGTGALPSLWPRLRELRGPVDLVAGELDPKFTTIAHRMGEQIPRARISIIENAGHAVHLEQPADLAALLG